MRVRFVILEREVFGLIIEQPLPSVLDDQLRKRSRTDTFLRSSIMRGEGPSGLPRRLAQLYPQWLARLAPRTHPVWWWFDRRALSRMARAAGGA